MCKNEPKSKMTAYYNIKYVEIARKAVIMRAQGWLKMGLTACQFSALYRNTINIGMN
jgi:hypothetical protein